MGLGSKVTDIRHVFGAYEAELRAVEDRLVEFFKSDALLISLVGRHLLLGGGKRLRPLFLLVSARLSGYKGDAHITLASIVELIHMASLLHDDVVDGATTRRGRPSAHSIWGNQVVILVGDFLYSNALKVSVSFKNQQIMETLSDATTSMAEGEVLQLSKAGDPTIKEDEYMKIISSKTGKLISAACTIGGILANRAGQEIDALAEFGLKAGMAFQMVDDILDYMAEENALGKRLGKDLEEGKITLPLIYLLDSVSEDIKPEIIDIIKGNGKGLNRVIELFKKYNALEDSMKRASLLIEEAKSALRVFGDCPEKEHMLCLADYALLRHN